MDWGRDPASPGTVRSGRSAHERKATVAAAGKIDVGGELTVNRLGFGAMRISGPGIWGDPTDRDRAKAALRRALALVLTFIDTADSCGPEVSERLIAESIGALAELKDEGQIRHVGVSNFTEDQPREAERVIAVVSVQNRYNVADRSSDPVLPIPGFGVPDHVEQNVAAASLELTPEEIRAITRPVVAACGVS